MKQSVRAESQRQTIHVIVYSRYDYTAEYTDALVDDMVRLGLTDSWEVQPAALKAESSLAGILAQSLPRARSPLPPVPQSFLPKTAMGHVLVSAIAGEVCNNPLRPLRFAHFPYLQPIIGMCPDAEVTLRDSLLYATNKPPTTLRSGYSLLQNNDTLFCPSSAWPWFSM